MTSSPLAQDTLVALKLSAVRLFAHELAPCLAFYRDTLGLPLTQDGSGHGYATFDAGGGLSLVLEHVAADAPPEDQALVARFSGLSFAVPDIAVAHATLLALGVVFTGAPELQFWGGTLATLRDPAGNEVQIVQYPGSAG